MPPPPSRILENLKQVHFTRVSWDHSSTAKPDTQPVRPVVSPTRSRFASEDTIGGAKFYPAGSPVPPEMSRRSEESDRRYHHEHRYHSNDRIVDEPESYVDPPAPPPELLMVAAPAKKKRGWKKIFSRKGKGKDKAGSGTHVDPLLSTHTESYVDPPLVIRPVAPGVPASDVSTSRRYELRDPGFMPHRMSVTQSRDESLRASEAGRERSMAKEGSVFGPRFERPEGSVRSQHQHQHHTYSHSQHSGSVFDAGPPPMLVDQQTGNQIPREISYASQTGSHQLSADGVPVKKKKRSLGGAFKRIFSRKKKVPPPAMQPVEEAVPVSQFVEHDEVHPLPPLPPPTHSSHASVVRPVLSARSSAGLPVLSPRSSGSRRTALDPTPEVVIPVSPRTTSPTPVPIIVPTRRGTGSSVVSVSRTPRRYNTGSSVSAAAPKRYNTGSSIADAAPKRYNTGSSVAAAAPKRYNTGSSFGFGRRGTNSSVRPAPAPAPVLPRVPGSASPSIQSVRGDHSWGEIHVPPEPEPAPSPRFGPGTTRTGLGLGTRPTVGTGRTVPARRTYTAPPARTPYVHVPRPIPPPPRYPTLPTTATTTAGGMDAQVQLIVAALRDLAADDRHRAALIDARLEEERAWTEAERAREAELRELVVRLAASRGGGGRVGEFGTREGGIGATASTPTRAGGFGTTGGGGLSAGLGIVGGAGEDAMLLCLLFAAR